MTAAVAGEVVALPGLELPPAGVGRFRSEARAHLEQLREAGRLDASHRLLVALIDYLADSADRSMGKIAGVQAAKQLGEAMASLPALVEETTSSEWRDVVDALAGGMPQASD